MIVGIIGAMEEEVEILKNNLENRSEKQIAGSKFYLGECAGHEVLLLQSGIGKVNAALGTTLLIHMFHPDCIINTGSAGGFDNSLNVGDVVVATEMRHHDVDVTAFGYEYGQVPGLPPFYLSDEKLIAVAEKAAVKTGQVNVVKGLVATGDSFMSDPERVAFVKTKFPKILAGEMEAAAIAQVCHQFKVPFVVIRALSDIAGKDAELSFDAFLVQAAKHSAEHILTMLKEMSSYD